MHVLITLLQEETSVKYLTLINTLEHIILFFIIINESVTSQDVREPVWATVSMSRL